MVSDGADGLVGSAALRAAVDVAVAELDSGLGVEMTPDEVMADIRDEIGLES